MEANKSNFRTSDPELPQPSKNQSFAFVQIARRNTLKMEANKNKILISPQNAKTDVKEVFSRRKSNSISSEERPED